ncbi:MAG: ribosomal biogenesis protein [Methanobacteriaceae archaeon]|nr:ribosomal biogenesis protein [Methanobacteriaceae archaeon]
MLITTSRKPSKRTRSFCKYLNRIFDSEYVNRGKMSMRDVILKLVASNYSYAVLVYEYNGNPSKITIFNKEGNELLSMTINIALPEERINIKKDQLSFKCDIDEMAVLEDVLISENNLDEESNLICIKESSNDYKAVLEVFDNKSFCTGFKIFVKTFKLKEESD